MTRPPGPGEVLGGCHLTAVLGEGGSAIVLAAEREGRSVAVKVLKVDGGLTPGTEERFRREGPLLARVRHPNVVQVLDFGIDGARAYLVLERIAGGALGAELVRGPLGFRRVGLLGEQLLAALVAIHEVGILHRDLTPSNLLVDGDRLVVTDFGLSRLVGEETVTRSRGIHMVLAYAPPERLAAKTQGPGADLYQAGLVLFEMATGRRPFTSPDPGKLAAAHLSREPPRVSELAAGLPPLLDEVVAKALRKQPEDRYRSAAEMQGDFRFVMGL